MLAYSPEEKKKKKWVLLELEANDDSKEKS